MSGSAATCTGCAQAQRRFRSTTPRLWCTRFHQPATARCEDYRSKARAIQAALNYVKAGSIK